MSIEQRKAVYKMAAIATNQRDLRKFRAETKDYYCKHEDELIKLVETVPNWQSYLTDKQLKIVELYINFRNTSAVDTHLSLTNGVTYHTLFGSMKDNQKVGGVLKKLQNAQKMLQKINDRKKGSKVV